MLGTQTINIFGFMGPMVMPLLFWVLAPNRTYGQLELYGIFLGGDLLSLIIFYSGVIIFCISLLQWFLYRHKQERFFTRGLYSKVRHPQFLGIVIVSLGLTMKLLTSSFGGGGLVGIPFVYTSHWLGMNGLIGLWFLQVLGYIAFALLEERSLSKRFPEFKEYKQKVPMLLPIRKPKMIPEAIFTIILVLVVCVILFLLPYDSIRIFQSYLF